MDVLWWAAAGAQAVAQTVSASAPAAVSQDLFRWIVGGMGAGAMIAIGFIWREIGRARDRAGQAEAAAADVERQLSDFRLEVAQTYASQLHLKETEGRILQELHFIRRALIVRDNGELRVRQHEESDR